MSQEVSIKFNAQLGGGAKAVFTSLANGLKQVAKGFQVLAKEQIKLGNKGAATALNETAKGLKKYTKEIDKTVKAQDKLTKSNKKTKDSTGKLGTAFNSLGRSIQTYSRYMVASNLILGVIGGFQNATKAVIEYDQALQDLKAITLGSTSETMMMGAAIVRVASLTKFSMGEVGGAMKRLAQAGFTASEVSGMIGSIAELATGSLESLDVTVKLVSTAIRVFGLSVNDTSSVVDTFANAVNKSRLTVSGLSTTFNYIGPIAAATGLSLKDTSASMMLLANAGLRFSTIGTGLRRIIGGLAKPSGKFKEAILSAGYTLADFNPNLSSFRDILAKLPNVVKDSTDAIEFFGYRGSSVISAFSTQGVAEYDRLREATNRVGTTSEMAAVQMKGLQNAIKNIKDRFGVLAKTLGEGGFTNILKGVVDITRKFLSVLIALAGSPIGGTIITLGMLSVAVTALIAGFIALTSISLTPLLAGWAAGFVALAGSMSGVTIASFQASAGVITLSSAFKGLLITMKALAFTPIGAALTIITTLLVGTVFWFNAKEKALRKTIIAQEKYTGSLDTAISHLESYENAVKKNGKNSVEANKQALKLRSGVTQLSTEYKELEEPLKKFADNIDETTGHLENQEETVAGLTEILRSEYKTAMLETMAKTNEMVKVTKHSAEAIDSYTKFLENNIEAQKKRAALWKNIRGFFKIEDDSDPLGAKGLEHGAKAIELLETRIKSGSESAKEDLKTLTEGGERLAELMLKRYITTEELSGMTDEQIRNEILGIGELTLAHKESAAIAEQILQKKRDAVDAAGPGTDAEKKRLEEVAEAYKYFGLSVDGSSKKLNSWVTKFNKFFGVGGGVGADSKATSGQLIEAFSKIGDSVKNVKDFEIYTKAMEKLRDSGRLTGQDLLVLQNITQEVFDGIKEAAYGMHEVMNTVVTEYYDKIDEKAGRHYATTTEALKKSYDEQLLAIKENYTSEGSILTLKHEAYVNYYNKLAALEASQGNNAGQAIFAEFEKKKQLLQDQVKNEDEYNKRLRDLEEERLTITIENLEERKTNYSDMITELKKYEESLTDKIKSEKEFRKNEEKSTNEIIRNLQYKLLTNEQKIAAEKGRLAQLHKKGMDEYYANDYEKSKKTLEETKQGYKDLANSIEKKAGSESKYFSEINTYAAKIKDVSKEILTVSKESQRNSETQKDQIVDQKEEFESITDGLKESIETTQTLLDGLVSDSMKKILELNKTLGDINDLEINEPMDDLKNSTVDTLKEVDKLIKALKTATQIKPTGSTVPTGFKAGGEVPGYGGGDKVPALLEKGEFVIRKERVKKYGVDLFNRFNQGLVNKVQAFSGGGIVPKDDNPATSFINSVNKSIPSMSSVAGAIQSGFNSLKTGAETGMEGLADFGRLKLQTNDSEFSVIAHKDVVAQLNSHLQEVRRFAT